jgi:hypothetical protein
LRRTLLSRANGASTSYGYDPVSRLSQLVQDPAGTTNDLTLGFSYNPASQIISNTRSNDSYAWTGHGSGTTSSPANGLNQLSSLGGTALTHDAKGNVTTDPHTGYTLGYSSENLLTIVNGGAWTGTIAYDPLMRLYEAGVNGKNRSLYDGMDRIAEYSSSGAQVAVELLHAALPAKECERRAPFLFICRKFSAEYQELGRYLPRPPGGGAMLLWASPAVRHPGRTPAPPRPQSICFRPTRR